MKTRISTIIFLVVMTALLAAVACGGSATAPLSTQPPPTETPAPTEIPVKGNPPPEEPETVVVPAPIDGAVVVAPATPDGEYTLNITSGLSSGCAQFDEFRIVRDGNRFVVDVTNLMPNPNQPIACTANYGYHESEVPLGSGLTPREAYSITINGDLAISFVAQDERGLAMVEKVSPIAQIEVTEADGGYLLSVVSRLPIGSSCSRFDGYQINRRFNERIEVTVTHLEISEKNVPCTDDLPSVSTEIPLGNGFESGRTYTVSVNGTEVDFPEAARTTTGETGSNHDAPKGTPAPIEEATVVVQALLVESKVAQPETVNAPYIVMITSGLPSGCTSFSHYFLSVEGNDFSVELVNRVPADKTISCATVYGYHDGQVTLGDSALNPGETYTVTINGELAHSFTAR
jgi:hypothetical protein